LGLAEEFVDGDSVCALLGDNVFFDDLTPVIASFTTGAHIFLKDVPDPQRFGVAEVDGSGRVLSLEEKPAKPKNANVTAILRGDNEKRETNKRTISTIRVI
jgi:glucose-1-phosphate thymidylyltransferase